MNFLVKSRKCLAPLAFFVFYFCDPPDRYSSPKGLDLQVSLFQFRVFFTWPVLNCCRKIVLEFGGGVEDAQEPCKEQGG